MRDAERQVLAIGRRQHGVVAKRQAIHAGVSPSAWQRLLSSGRVEPVHRGVGRVAGSPRSFPQQVMAGVLAAGPTAVGSHSSGARLWGAELSTPFIEVTSTDRSRGARPAGVVLHRPTDLLGLTPVRRLGIPVTSPLRTLVDLGASATAADVEATLEHFVVSRLVTVRSVSDALRSHGRPGRTGAGVLRAVLERWAFADSVPDSRLEVALARLLRAHALPPAVHHLVVGRYELDFAWPDLAIALEADGWASHGRRSAFEHDRRRDLELAARGWHVLRTTRHAVLVGSAHLVDCLVGTLGRRAS